MGPVGERKPKKESDSFGHLRELPRSLTRLWLTNKKKKKWKAADVVLLDPLCTQGKATVEVEMVVVFCLGEGSNFLNYP